MALYHTYDGDSQTGRSPIGSLPLQGRRGESQCALYSILTDEEKAMQEMNIQYTRLKHTLAAHPA